MDDISSNFSEKLKLKNKLSHFPKPVVLLIISGWGIAPASASNLISQAETPNFDSISSSYKTFVLNASGEEVGLLPGQPGNSKIGSLNIGSGRIIYQPKLKIDRAIKNNSFFSNSSLLNAFNWAKKNNSAVHLLGLVSSAETHSSLNHLIALLRLAKRKRVKKLYLHLFLDGLDAAPDEGIKIVQRIEKEIKKLKIGEIASLTGRIHAMDRDNHWRMTERTYLALTSGETESKAIYPGAALLKFYQQGTYDKEILPTIIVRKSKPIGLIKNKDSLIFFNFRSDRMRQLVEPFVRTEFTKFERKKFLKDLFVLTFTSYGKDLKTNVAFPSEKIVNSLGEVLAKKGISQARLADAEGFSYVTYFFNGEREEPFPQEEDILIPSANLSPTEQSPAMAVPKITKTLIQYILDNKFDFFVVNFSNLKVISSAQNKEAVIKAIEVVDQALRNIKEIVLSKNGILLITSDHGRVEDFINLPTGEIKRESTINPVPFILVGNQWEEKGGEKGFDLSLLKPKGKLADIAPTILKILRIRKPKEMTGRSLI